MEQIKHKELSVKLLGFMIEHNISIADMLILLAILANVKKETKGK